jgi:hypothetical protein
VVIYSLGLLAWLLWPAFRESLIGKFVAIPLFSIYLFEHFGVPGLTDRASCDWMWCTPTALGVVVVGGDLAWRRVVGRGRHCAPPPPDPALASH